MFPELMVSLFFWVLNCNNGPAARMRSVSISRSCFFKHGPLCLVLKRVCADAHTFAKNANVWGTPGRYTADVNYRYVFSRARHGPPAPALRFAIGRATRGAAEAVPFPFVLEHRCRMRQDGAKPRHHTSFPRTKTREGSLPPASLYAKCNSHYAKCNSQLHQPLIQHGVCDLQEARDIGAIYQVAWRAIFLARFEAVLVDGDHDLVQTIVDFFAGPGDARAVLRHFQPGGGNAAGIGGLGRSVA